MTVESTAALGDHMPSTSSSRNDDHHTDRPISNGCQDVVLKSTSPEVQEGPNTVLDFKYYKNYAGDKPLFKQDSRSKVTTTHDLLSNPRKQSIDPATTSIVRRIFPTASYVMSMRTPSLYQNVDNSVMQSKLVQDAIIRATNEEMGNLNDHFQDSGDELMSNSVFATLRQKHLKRSYEMLNKMKASISSTLLRLAGWVLFKFLGHILNRVHYDQDQLDVLKKMSTASKHPMVYLPIHRSHMDYVLISFILYMNHVSPPMVAAGDNLYLPLFAGIMKGLGAFFIKRRLDAVEGHKDHVYRSVLQSYLIQNLKRGHPIEFFIEGGRSRSGKVYPYPKAGLLSILVSAIVQNQLDDVLIVPVGISYDKVIDGTFSSEQMGRNKEPESFTQAIKSIYSAWKSNYGSVRVDFSTPFSLKEFMNTNTDSSSLPLMELSPPSSDPLHKVASSADSLFTLDDSPDFSAESQRRMIQMLAETIICEAATRSSVMATHVLAFVLLTNYRNGATMAQLEVTIKWIREELKRKGRHLSFCGDSNKMVTYAKKLLGPNLIRSQFSYIRKKSFFNPRTVSNGVNCSNGPVDKRRGLASTPNGHENGVEVSCRKVYFLQPNLSLSSLIQLKYYSNSVASSFIFESIIVNAVFRVFDWNKDSIEEIEGNNNHVAKHQVMTTAIQLCHLFKYEFILFAPSYDIEDSLNKVIEDLALRGLFSLRLEGDERGHRRGNRDFLEFEDGDDDGFNGNFGSGEILRVEVNSTTIEFLRFYKSILGSFIESYWVGAMSLRHLIRGSMTYTQFMGMVYESGREQVNLNNLEYHEAMFADPLKNSINLFEHRGIIQRSRANGMETLFLTPNYNDLESVNRVIDEIAPFKA